MLLPNKPSRSLISSSKRVLTFLFKELCDYSSVRIFIFNFLLLFLILIFRYKFLTCIFINLCFIMIWCFNPQNFRSQLQITMSMRYGAIKILIIIVVVMLWYQSFPFIALIERASTTSISSKFHAACRRVPDVSLVLCCWKTKTDAVCYFENKR